MRIKRSIISLFLALVLVLVTLPSVSAHGFGERYDLPVPLDYFVGGSAATVALSFLIIAFFIRKGKKEYEYPHFNLIFSFSVFQVYKIFKFILGVLAVFLLIGLIISGLFGTEDALDNFAPTFVWIIWWVGIGYIVALLGNVWLIINPWLVIFGWFEKFKGCSHKPILNWKDKWDAWPALIIFLSFAWIENVYPGASSPKSLSILVILYSIITFSGMLIFGKHVWLRNGDPFTVLFSLFARFSPTEIRVNSDEGQNMVCCKCSSKCESSSDLSDCVDCYECWEMSSEEQRQFNIRPWATGLCRGERVTPALVAFHLTALASVTFDGFSETPIWVEVQTLLWPVVDPLPGPAVATINSFGTLAFPLLFGLLYVQVCGNVSKLSNGEMSKNSVILSFVFSLVPIALAYNLSHYLSFLLITGQQIVPLVSDPLGVGWNLLGTADYRPNIAIINARIAWIVSIVSLVSGHVVSVYIAHVISLRRTSSHKIAIRSQYPMLALMVFYTGVSLWIIAQPIVE
ncbi:MAG: hypothetical protein CL781_07425 [Chloroflexi bacterium]|nr:hypothetical protein [Chloroflexota bacterium]|tara:strand:+ start:1553 stop:3097 length:1545 start_codon:yes stop_codon:yes gene_type:complete